MAIFKNFFAYLEQTKNYDWRFSVGLYIRFDINIIQIQSMHQENKFGVKFKNMPMEIVLGERLQAIRPHLSQFSYYAPNLKFDKKTFSISFDQMLQYIESWNIYLFYAWDRKFALTQIIDIKFINLSQIQLGKNKLATIELLSRCHFSNLQNLSITENNIVSMRSLIKLCAPKLTRVCLDKNYITDMDENISLLGVKPSLKKIESENYPEFPCQLLSVNSLAKLNLWHLEAIYLASRDRILQNSSKRLTEGFKNLTIHDKSNIQFYVSDGDTSSFQEDASGEQEI